MRDISVCKESIVSISKDQVSSDFLDEETVILNLSDGVYYGLDPVGSRIWRLIQEEKTVGELIQLLLGEYKVEPERCEREVLAFLETMESKGLVTIAEAHTV